MCRGGVSCCYARLPLLGAFRGPVGSFPLDKRTFLVQAGGYPRTGRRRAPSGSEPHGAVREQGEGRRGGGPNRNTDWRRTVFTGQSTTRSISMSFSEQRKRLARWRATFGGNNSELLDRLRDRKHTKAEFKKFSVYCPRARTDTPHSPAMSAQAAQSQSPQTSYGGRRRAAGALQQPCGEDAAGTSLRKPSRLVPASVLYKADGQGWTHRPVSPTRAGGRMLEFSAQMPAHSLVCRGRLDPPPEQTSPPLCLRWTRAAELS